MTIGWYLLVTASNLIFLVSGYVLGKPWLDRRLVKPTQKPPTTTNGGLTI